ncbi:hypothetical protein AMTRI_Chr12g271780 [Amborella trichopoda]
MLRLNHWHPISFSRLLCTVSYSSDAQKLSKLLLDIGNLDDIESNLNQSEILISPPLVTQVMESCTHRAQTRRLLRFFTWSAKQPTCKLPDTLFNHAIKLFASLKDLRAMELLVTELKRESRGMGIDTWAAIATTMVDHGKEDQAIGIFKNIEKYRCPRDEKSLNLLVHALCARGHARKAEGVVWNAKNWVSMDSYIFTTLIHGWCIKGEFKDARRVFEEMRSNGFSPNLVAYHSLIRCVCAKNLRINPSALVRDFFELVMEMRSNSVFPTTISFNILISYLGRARRVKEADQVFRAMVQEGCDPDYVSYFLVVRLLYLTGRMGKGNEMVDEMIQIGLKPKARFYHSLTGVLCGVEKVDHALWLLARMKENCSEVYGPTYDLLITKLCKGGKFEIGRKLWDEALERGAVLQCSVDLLDPSKTEVYKPKRKERMTELAQKGQKKNKKKQHLQMQKTRKKKK